jgi:hypothetical protein
MKQHYGTGSEEQQADHAAALSDQDAQRISVIDPIGEGIKVCDSNTFDPYRFHEFDFSPEFREKMMRAPLPLLDLRELHDDKGAHERQRRAGPNDVTQPAAANRDGTRSSAQATADDEAAQSQVLARKKARKNTGAALEGKPAKKWKFLLFGSLVAVVGSITK